MENDKGVTVSASEVALPSTSSSIQQQACSSQQFSCPICEYVNDKLSALETHIENEHFPSSEPKAFFSNQHLFMRVANVIDFMVTGRTMWSSFYTFYFL